MTHAFDGWCSYCGEKNKVVQFSIILPDESDFAVQLCEECAQDVVTTIKESLISDGG